MKRLAIAFAAFCAAGAPTSAMVTLGPDAAMRIISETLPQILDCEKNEAPYGHCRRDQVRPDPKIDCPEGTPPGQCRDKPGRAKPAPKENQDRAPLPAPQTQRFNADDL